MIRNVSSELLKSIASSKDIKQSNITEALKDTLHVHQSKAEDIVGQQIPKKMNEVMDSLLKSVSNGDVSLKEIAKELPKNTLLKQTPSISSEIGKLVELIKKEPSLQKYVNPLKAFMKDISEVTKPQNLQEQISKSGIKFEANLKEILQAQPISARVTQKIETLLSQIQKDTFPKATQNALKSELSSLLKEDSKASLVNVVKNLQTSIKQMSVNVHKSSIFPILKEVGTLEALINKHSIIASKVQHENVANIQDIKTLHVNNIEKIQESIKNISNIIKENSLPLPDVKELSARLLQKEGKESVLRFLNTLPESIKSIEIPKNVVQVLSKEIKNLENLVKNQDVFLKKEETQIQNTLHTREIKTPLHVQYETKVKETLKSIVEQINKRPLPLPKENMTQNKAISVQKEVYTNLNEISQKIQTLKDMPLIKEVFSQPQAISTIQTQVVSSSSTLSQPLSVQEQLKSVVIQLKNTLSLLDKPAVSTMGDISVNKELLKEFQNFAKEPKLPLLTKTSEFKELPPQLKDDVKHTLLKLQESVAGQKETTSTTEIKALTQSTLTKIEMHQLLSHASNSLNVYVPYLWDSMSEGNINFKASQDGKSFTCKIDLKLQKHGKVDVLLMLFDDNHINAKISLESKELQKTIEENLPLLKKGLSSVGFIPLHVKSFEFKKTEEKTDLASSVGMNIRA